MPKKVKKIKKTITKMVNPSSLPKEKQVECFSSAILMGKKRLIETYAKNKAILNEQNKDGFVPLQTAMIADDFKTFKMLLEKGAEADGIDKNGNTPLASLCCLSKETAPTYEEEFLRSLILEGGADIRKKNKYGFDPIDIAIMSGRDDLVDLLCRLDIEKARYNPKESKEEGFYSDLSSASEEIKEQTPICFTLAC